MEAKQNATNQKKVLSTKQSFVGVQNDQMCNCISIQIVDLFWVLQQSTIIWRREQSHEGSATRISKSTQHTDFNKL